MVKHSCSTFQEALHSLSLSRNLSVLVQLLSRNSSICQRVDGINHEVRLGVVILLQSITMAMGSDCFHDNLCSWYLLLDVAFQNTDSKKRRREKKMGFEEWGCIVLTSAEREKKLNSVDFQAEKQKILRRM